MIQNRKFRATTDYLRVIPFVLIFIFYASNTNAQDIISEDSGISQQESKTPSLMSQPLPAEFQERLSLFYSEDGESDFRFDSQFTPSQFSVGSITPPEGIMSDFQRERYAEFARTGVSPTDLVFDAASVLNALFGGTNTVRRNINYQAPQFRNVNQPPEIPDWP